MSWRSTPRRWPGNSAGTRTTFGGLTRSALMSRIRGKRNATTELKLVSLFRAAHLRGWRRNFPLPGKPDFVFPKSKLAVFVDGCFWHGHGCGRNLKPKRNASLWKEKFAKNWQRDVCVTRDLRIAGWKVIRVWECTLAKQPNACLRRIQKATATSAEFNATTILFG